ncbi:MAG: flagellar hook-associated protein 1 FlgK [Myxococcota bacterium]|jgi:flagellar hook-associated protein 1 FlgK
MPTIQHILSTAHAGLQSAQATVAQAGQNMANVNTPGYARERLPISAAVAGLGVKVGDPVAVRDQLLERALGAARSRTGFYQQEESSLRRVESAINDLDGFGVGPSLQAFNSALSNLSANPSGLVERNGVLLSASELAVAFDTTRTQLSRGRDDSIEQAEALSTRASGVAAQVAALNVRISQSAGSDANALISQRSDLIQQLSGMVGIETVARSDGSVQVQTAGGRALVDAGTSLIIEIEFGPPPERTPGMVMKRANGERLGPMGPVGGAIGGALEAVEGTIDPALAELDDVAFEFMTAFNEAHRAGFDLQGATGTDFFTVPTDRFGAASGMGLSDAVVGEGGNIAAAVSLDEVPGGNGNLSLLADVTTRQGTLPNGLSVLDGMARLNADVAQRIARSASNGEIETASMIQLENLFASSSGVDIDEELIRITQANTVLTASTTVLQEVQSMNQTILSIIR